MIIRPNVRDNERPITPATQYFSFFLFGLLLLPAIAFISNDTHVESSVLYPDDTILRVASPIRRTNRKWRRLDVTLFAVGWRRKLWTDRQPIQITEPRQNIDACTKDANLSETQSRLGHSLLEELVGNLLETQVTSWFPTVLRVVDTFVSLTIRKLITPLEYLWANSYTVIGSFSITWHYIMAFCSLFISLLASHLLCSTWSKN